MLAMMSPFAPSRMLDSMMADALAYDVLTRDVVHARRRRLSSSPLRLGEVAGKYSVSITAPGIAPADLSIEAVNEGQRLVVRAETKSRSLHYSISMPEDADASAASAEMADGLLVVSIPKKTEVEPARIVVDISTSATDEVGAAESSQPRPYKLSVVAAGIAATDLEVSIEKGVLAMHGKSTRTGATLERSFCLPRDADATTAEATHIDGILTVTIAKKPVAEPTHIAVTAPLVAVETASDEAAMAKQSAVENVMGADTDQTESQQAKPMDNDEDNDMVMV